MNKKWSLKLGSVSSIGIYVHWTFLILIGWIILMHLRMGHGINDVVLGVAFVLAIFVCVTLHELGHALTAKRFKIVTRNIVLLPIGGIANMERMPEKPSQEFLVAIAGPAVNLLIASVIGIIIFLGDGFPSMSDFRKMEDSHELMAGSHFLFNLLFINVLLAVFNLIPAFPMDGGRILRAALAAKLDREKATRIAAGIGQFLAIGFVFAGFFGNFWLVFIGVFIYLGAGAEAAFEKTKSMLAGHKLREVVMTEMTIFHPFDRTEIAVKRMLESQEKNFVVAESGKVEGVLTQAEIVKGMVEHGPDTPVAQIMNRNFIRLVQDEDLEEAYFKMKKGGHVVSPVFRDGELIGIVDSENISEWLLLQKVGKKS